MGGDLNRNGIPDAIEQLILSPSSELPIGIDVSDFFDQQDEWVENRWEAAWADVAAQYRFMGLLAGYTSEGYNPEHAEVQRARDGVVNAIKDFLQVADRETLANMWQDAREQSAGIVRDYPDAQGIVETIFPDLPEGTYPTNYEGNLTSYPGQWVSAEHGAGVEYAQGLRTDPYNRVRVPVYYDENGNYSQQPPPEFYDRVEAFARTVQDASILREEIGDREIANIIGIIAGVWNGVKEWYDEKMAFWERGFHSYVANTVAIDTFVTFHVEIIIGAVALTLGPVLAAAGVVVAAAALNAALSASIRVVRIGTRAADRAVEGVLDLRRRIEVRPVTQGTNGTPRQTGATGENFDFDIPDDLTERERNIMGESRSGSTEADVDHDPEDRPNANAPTEHLNEDGSLKDNFKFKNPHWDHAEIRRRVGEDLWPEVEIPGRGGVEARQKLITEFHNFFGLSDANTNIRGSRSSDPGMNVNNPMRLVVYPPPHRVTQWVRADARGNKTNGGNYFDPNERAASPNELGVNSVGRALEEFDLSRSPGLAFQGQGAPITDTWTLRDAPRSTDAGRPQWYVPQEYVAQMRDSRMTGTTWRDLPGNSEWLAAFERGELYVNNQGYWVYNGPPIPENGRVR